MNYFIAFRDLCNYLFKHHLPLRGVLKASLLIILCMGLLSSCQIEKRQYVRGFFINKTACEFDSCKIENICNADTNSCKKEVENSYLAKKEIIKYQNNDKTLASTNNIVANDLFATDKTKQASQSFFAPKDTSIIIPLKFIQKDSRRIDLKSVDLLKVHPLVKAAAAILLIDIISIFVLPQFSISGMAAWIIFFLCLPISSIVLLLLARIKTKKDPDKWKGIGCITAAIIGASIVVATSEKNHRA